MRFMFWFVVCGLLGPALHAAEKLVEFPYDFQPKVYIPYGENNLILSGVRRDGGLGDPTIETYRLERKEKGDWHIVKSWGSHGQLDDGNPKLLDSLVIPGREHLLINLIWDNKSENYYLHVLDLNSGDGHNLPAKAVLLQKFKPWNTVLVKSAQLVWDPILERLTVVSALKRVAADGREVSHSIALHQVENDLFDFSKEKRESATVKPLADWRLPGEINGPQDLKEFVILDLAKSPEKDKFEAILRYARTGAPYFLKMDLSGSKPVQTLEPISDHPDWQVWSPEQASQSAPGYRQGDPTNHFAGTEALRWTLESLGAGFEAVVERKDGDLSRHRTVTRSGETFTDSEGLTHSMPPFLGEIFMHSGTRVIIRRAGGRDAGPQDRRSLGFGDILILGNTQLPASSEEAVSAIVIKHPALNGQFVNESCLNLLVTLSNM